MPEPPPSRIEAREKLLENLEDAAEWSLANRLRKCGEKIFIICTCCGARHEVQKRCDLKWCPTCQPLLARRTVERYAPVMSQIQWPLFVTLTTQNYANATDSREVRRAFTKLRRHRWWKRAVQGGVAQLEVSNRGKGWHPHIHALCDCRWLSVTVPSPRANATAEQFRAIARRACSEVAASFSDCLGGRRSSVKVRRVWRRDGGDISGAMREVLKYSVSPDTLNRPTKEVVECIHALDRTRNLVSWGTLYRRPELKRVKHPLACKCGSIGSFITENEVDHIARSSRRR